MQVIILLKKMLAKMDMKLKDFLWSNRHDKTRHMHVKAWDSICIPKGEGGLGIKKMEDMNIA